MKLVRTARVAVVAATMATVIPAGVALADSVFDKQRDNPAGTLDINTASVDLACKPTFAITVLPQNGLRGVDPRSGILPAIQLDRDGDGRTDRLIGQPNGKSAGVYAVSGNRLGRRLAAVTPSIDPGQGYFVQWRVGQELVVKGKRIRWRAVSRSVLSGSVDRAPDSGFRNTRFTVICR